MEADIKEKLFKVLSKNDTGETNSHQSGISIPKAVAKSSIFPQLGTDVLNPRTSIVFYDLEGEMFEFQYIYYNDIFFGKPKDKGHNEFRLTCVKDFIRKYNLIHGDQIWFGISRSGVRYIGFIKQDYLMAEEPIINYGDTPNIIGPKSYIENGVTIIKIGKNWKNIKY